MVNGGDSSQTVNEEELRYIAGVFGGLLEVSKTSLFPSNKQESLLIFLDTEHYPNGIDEVWLELRLFTDGDFHISYVEEYLGEIRRCRWDRHEQDHNTRDHFHPPPKASTANAQDREFPADILIVLQDVVLPWVEGRLGELWETESENG